MNCELIRVGILAAKNIRFRLDEGAEQVVTCVGEKLLLDGKEYDELVFSEQDSFTLYDVVIGISFHWQRKENQVFSGTLKFIVEDGKVRAINILPVEDYLVSVISSEMSATASLEFLKAHAVISRSWVSRACMTRTTKTLETRDIDGSHIKWYDRDDHDNFDVCADDHCQRYQGITRASTPIVREAVESTRGEVLMYDGEICDARFSKCCGGVLEQFEYCWEDEPKAYLLAKRDDAGTKDESELPDLTVEENAREWILSSPDSLCNTIDKKVLSQVLNNYDQETVNFYRWKQVYTREEISKLIKRKLGIDFGEITDLIPVARGKSGRIWKLKIVGTKQTLSIGKELEIRRALSETHLYSSAFVVEKTNEGFILYGAGWGHGVGLCQIGAAVMGEKGYRYDEILHHYYPGAIIEVKND